MFEESQNGRDRVADGWATDSLAPAKVSSSARRIEGSLANYVSALVALDMRDMPWQTLRLMPRASFVLCGAFADGDDAFAGTMPGKLTRYSGAPRSGTTLRAGGSGLSYYALLTPLGVVTLFEGRRVEGLPACASLADNLFETRDIKYLEQCMACAASSEDRLHRFGTWLEQRIVARRRVAATAMRAARVALRLRGEHRAGVEDLASGEGLTRRQLERDFRRHLDLSPSRYAGGIRLQAALRMAVSGQPLAAIAAELDFADQAHLCHAIKLHTGLTPRAIVGAARLPLSRLFLEVGEEILVVPEEPSVAAPGSVVMGHMTAREHMALTSGRGNSGAHTDAHQSPFRACAPQALPQASACEGEH